MSFFQSPKSKRIFNTVIFILALWLLAGACLAHCFCHARIALDTSRVAQQIANVPPPLSNHVHKHAIVLLSACANQSTAVQEVQ